MSSRLVVLGSTGLIGGALVTMFRKYKGLEVTGYQSSDFSLAAPGADHALLDIVDDETILVVAARSSSTMDPTESFLNDVAMSANVGRCISRKKIKRLVYFSSLAVYGDITTNLAITEETKIAPSSLYGLAKFTGECMIRQIADKTGISTVVLRPCAIYGPGDRSHAYGPNRFINSILKDRNVHLFGDGKDLREYLFVDDLAKIAMQFILGNQTGVYNLGTGRSHSFQEIVACLRKVSDRDFEVFREERVAPKVDQRIDLTRLRTVLSGTRFVTLDRGLKLAYNDSSKRTFFVN